MLSIKNSIQAIFPATPVPFITESYTSVIKERDKGATFLQFTWSDKTHPVNLLYTFTPELAKDLGSFFDKYNCIELYRKDCDGVMMFEIAGQKYMFLSELKSAFTTQNVYKAKKQILSSYIKFNMLLNLTHDYRTEHVKVKGFIVCPEPTSELKSDCRKALYTHKSTPDYVFCGKLLWNTGNYVMTRYQSEMLYNQRLGSRGIFPEIEWHYIKVPSGSKTHTADISKYI